MCEIELPARACTDEDAEMLISLQGPYFKLSWTLLLTCQMNPKKEFSKILWLRFFHENCLRLLLSQVFMTAHTGKEKQILKRLV